MICLLSMLCGGTWELPMNVHLFIALLTTQPFCCFHNLACLTHWGLVNFGNLGHRLLKRLVIQTAAAELAAAVCITSHFNNHWSKHRHVGTWNDALDIRNPDLLSETVLNLPTPYGVTRPQWVKVLTMLQITELWLELAYNIRLLDLNRSIMHGSIQK